MLLALAAAEVRAQPYQASWWTVDGGGAAAAAGGSFVLAGTAGQPDAGGPFAAGAFQLRSGFWAIVGDGTAAQQADLALTKTDGPDPVTAGGMLTYTITATNLGPAASPSTIVTDPLPAGVAFVAAGAGCTHSGGTVTCALGTLAPAAAVPVTITVAVGSGVTGLLTNTAAVSGGAPDPLALNNTDSETTLVTFRPRGELAHGSVLRADLAAFAGAADVDLYRILQQPHASYEIVLDEAAGDVGMGAGPSLDRVGPDGATVLQSAQPAGTGPARSLRFVNETSAAVPDQLVRVRSGSCTSDCGPDDTYRLRAWETTGSVPRFNNSGTQVTVLLLQNPTAAAVAGTVYLWSASGAPAGEQPFTLDPHALLVLNTSALAPGAGGSLTVVHDGPYGALAGKTVALEPATGFSFDSPLVPRPR